MRPGARHQRRRQDHQAVERRGPAARRVCTGRHARRRRRPAGAAAPFDAKLDTQVTYSLYAVIPSPVDDTVWGVGEQYPGFLVRLHRGNNPPQPARAQIFKVPEPGFDPRGVDIDRDGVVWTALAATSHLASFDVRKCKDLNGPRSSTAASATKAGRSIRRPVRSSRAPTSRPTSTITTGWTSSTSPASGRILRSPPVRTRIRCSCSNPQTGSGRTLRVPYPLGFYSRGMDGRIDDRERRMEGPRALGQLRHPLRVAHRGRQGDQGQDREVPDPAGSSGEVAGGDAGPWCLVLGLGLVRSSWSVPESLVPGPFLVRGPGPFSVRGP